jgi:ubiquinol-cytochrome c reductase cytochrome b/c1 subunit
MIFGVVILHVWALHVPGQNNPTGVPIKSGKDAIPFTPYATIKDIFATAVFLIFFAYFVFYIPNFMGHADNYVPANPSVTPSHIVPEWYFLPFYAILRAIPDKLGGVIAMFASIAVLAFVPWLDTSRVRSTAYRPLYKQFFWILVADAILLGWLGAKPPEGWYVIVSQVATAYYFIHFLVILPVLGFVERPLPLPNSILESVMGGRKQGAGIPAGANAEPQSRG